MTAIKIDHVSEQFRVYHDKRTSFKDFLISFKRAQYSTFWALHDVTIDIPKGDIFGVIGDNGSGKSTLLKCIAGIMQPTQGTIAIDGRISPLLELGAGFHSDLTGRENIYLNSSILGMPRRRMQEKEDEIIAFAELEEFIDSPLRGYSSGMRMRLGFAIAINVEPDILLIDEVLAVGDKDFQAKCLDKLQEFMREKKTIVFVSHTLSTVREICTRGAWLNKGRLEAIGRIDDVIDSYLDGTGKKKSSGERIS